VAGLLLSLVLFPLFAPNSAAAVEYIDLDFVIDRHEFRTVRLEAMNHGSVEVSMELDGNYSIDVMIMDLDDYDNYQTGAERIRYLSARLDVLAAHMLWQAQDNSSYYIVLDNTDKPEDGAESYYTVSGHILVTINRPVTPGPDRSPEPADKGFYPWLGLLLALALICLGAYVMLSGFMPTKRSSRRVYMSPRYHDRVQRYMERDERRRYL